MTLTGLVTKLQSDKKSPNTSRRECKDSNDQVTSPRASLPVAVGEAASRAGNKRPDTWIEDLREQFRAEKQQYMERISELESRLIGAMGVEEDLGHAHLQPAITVNPTDIEECGQERVETLSLHLLPEVRGNVNSFEFEHVQWGTLPPRVGDGFETQYYTS